VDEAAGKSNGITKRHLLPAISDSTGISLVIRLLKPFGPMHIARLIVSIGILSLNGMIQGWTWSDISKKALKSGKTIQVPIAF
jgi:hypothetical protein